MDLSSFLLELQYLDKKDIPKMGKDVRQSNLFAPFHCILWNFFHYSSMFSPWEFNKHSFLRDNNSAQCQFMLSKQVSFRSIFLLLIGILVHLTYSK